MGCMQAREPVLASFLHQNIISHASLGKAMAVLLANKLSSRTLLGTQLMQLINEAYRDDPVRTQLPSSDNPCACLTAVLVYDALPQLWRSCEAAKLGCRNCQAQRVCGAEDKMVRSSEGMLRDQEGD